MESTLAEFREAVTNYNVAVEALGVDISERREKYKDYDPYDTIKPALLNAGDVATYSVLGGMIEPFDLANLEKPATYLVSAKGPCRYRDENGNIERFFLSDDPNDQNSQVEEVRDFIRIAPNSVCFVTLEPIFHMPSYIGARFNLMIRDVYRGLLVGTGPLVDPGFSGKLSIPIHNFTTREYFIRAGDGLVYFEFTKLSWVNPSRARPANLPNAIEVQPPFPGSKNKRRNIDDYLDQATGGGPPQNAIGAEIASLRKHADDAKNLLRFYSVAGVAAAVGLFYSGWSLYSAAQQFVQSAQSDLSQKVDSTSDEVRELREELTKARVRIDQLEQRSPNQEK